MCPILSVMSEFVKRMTDLVNKQSLKLSLGVKALTALVEDVQLQHITGTHSISLTNDVFKFGIFGDQR